MPFIEKQNSDSITFFAVTVKSYLLKLVTVTVAELLFDLGNCSCNTVTFFLQHAHGYPMVWCGVSTSLRVRVP